MRVLLVLSVAACSFNAPASGLDGSAIDASSIDAPVVPTDGTPLGDWGTPVPVAELNTLAHDDDPTLTGDMLEIYFASDRSLLTGEDIYVATRASITDPFGAPVLVSELSSAVLDSNVDITANGLVITFTSTRGGGPDLYFSARTNRSEAWGAPALVPGVNSGQGEFGMVMTADLLEAVLCSDRGTDEALFRSKRTTILQPFGSPVRMIDIDTDDHECDPMLPDPRTLYFTRGSNVLDLDIYVATSSDGTTFDQITPEATLNTEARDGDPWISPDQRTMFLASNRLNLINTDDIFISTR